MQRVAVAILLSLVVPGLLLPGGIEFRMCFCSGLGGPCCHDAAPERRVKCGGCCSARKADARTANGVHATAQPTSRCSGCVRVTVPKQDPVRNDPPVTCVAILDKAPSALAPILTLMDAPRPVAPVLWHPPPEGRNLPLLI